MIEEDIDKKMQRLSQNFYIDEDLKFHLKQKFIKLSKESENENNLNKKIYTNSVFKKLIIFRIIFIILTLVLLGIFTISLINNSKPGNLLYSTNRILENVQVNISSLGGDRFKAYAYLNLAQKRVSDIAYVIESKNSNNFSFLIQPIFADGTSISLTTQQEQMISQLSNNYQLDLNEAFTSLNNLKSINPNQAKELANSMLEVTDNLQNTLRTIKAQITNDTSFIFDRTINFTSNLNKETFNIFYDFSKVEGQSIISDKVKYKIDSKNASSQKAAITEETINVTNVKNNNGKQNNNISFVKNNNKVNKKNT